MGDRETLRRRCEAAMRAEHVDPAGNPFPYVWIEAQTVLDLLDATEAREST